jgi:hypothetical protein
LVRTSLSNEAFRISIANVLGDLRKEIKTQDLPQYDVVFRSLIAQSDLFGEIQWQDVADLSKRSLSQSDISLHDFGMSMIESMVTIPERDQSDLLHLLIDTTENSNEALKIRATAKLGQLSKTDLTDSARRVLENRQPRS